MTMGIDRKANDSTLGKAGHLAIVLGTLFLK
jgi:hypothetical protein